MSTTGTCVMCGGEITRYCGFCDRSSNGYEWVTKKCVCVDPYNPDLVDEDESK